MKKYFVWIYCLTIAGSALGQVFGDRVGEAPNQVLFRGRCLNGISEQQRSNLNQNIQTMFQKMSECRDNYPEFSDYIDQWFVKARRLNVQCRQLSTDQDGRNSFFRVALTPETFTSLTTSPTDNSHYVSTGTSPISGLAAISVLTHEFFHSTDAHAHNPSHHWDIENESPPELLGYNASVILNPRNLLDTNNPANENDCADDVVFDRINFISNLCIGRPIGDRRVESQLGGRILRCGLKKGCMDIFTEERSTLRLPALRRSSRHLSEDVAQNLCLRLAAQAQCLESDERRATARTFSDLLLADNSSDVSQRQIRPLKPRLNRALSAEHTILPFRKLGIAPGFLAGNTGLSEMMSSLQTNACFSSAFFRLDQTFYLQADRSQDASMSLDLYSDQREASNVRKPYDALRADFRIRRESWPACRGRAGSEVESFLIRLTQRENRLRDTQLFQAILETKSFNLRHIKWRENFALPLSSAGEREVSFLSEFIPRPLLTEFIQKINEAHPFSPQNRESTYQAWASACPAGPAPNVEEIISMGPLPVDTSERGEGDGVVIPWEQIAERFQAIFED